MYCTIIAFIFMEEGGREGRGGMIDTLGIVFFSFITTAILYYTMWENRTLSISYFSHLVSQSVTASQIKPYIFH